LKEKSKGAEFDCSPGKERKKSAITLAPGTSSKYVVTERNHGKYVVTERNHGAM
jgi:uncharacterized cupredoxin-like copper-binding protein